MIDRQPDEIAALNNFIAEKVMGWEEEDGYWKVDGRKVPNHYTYTWNPYENDAQAAMVRRRMGDEGWDMEMSTEYHEGEPVTTVTFTKADEEGVWVLEEADTESAATCEATAKALG